MFNTINKYQPWWTHWVYAWITLLTGLVSVVTLGLVHPGWIMDFSYWRTKRAMMMKKAERENNLTTLREKII